VLAPIPNGLAPGRGRRTPHSGSGGAGSQGVSSAGGATNGGCSGRPAVATVQTSVGELPASTRRRLAALAQLGDPIHVDHRIQAERPVARPGARRRRPGAMPPEDLPPLRKGAPHLVPLVATLHALDMAGHAARASGGACLDRYTSAVSTVSGPSSSQRCWPGPMAVPSSALCEACVLRGGPAPPRRFTTVVRFRYCDYDEDPAIRYSHGDGAIVDMVAPSSGRRQQRAHQAGAGAPPWPIPPAGPCRLPKDAGRHTSRTGQRLSRRTTIPATRLAKPTSRQARMSPHGAPWSAPAGASTRPALRRSRQLASRYCHRRPLCIKSIGQATGRAMRPAPCPTGLGWPGHRPQVMTYAMPL
jgi:hypothetical protein